MEEPNPPARSGHRPAPQIHFCWPGGKPGAVTSSWDDGCIHDPRLLEVFRSHGLRGTFHLNSGLLRGARCKDPFYLEESRVAEIYAGQEIAAHSLTHPSLWTLSDDLVFHQLLEDRRNLEALAGYPVTGLAFPCGRGGDDDRLESIARRAGLRMARASNLDGNFSAPTNWLRWGVACHFSGFDESWRKFEAAPRADKLFFWWGHSHEFENKYGWGHLDDIARRLRGARFWHATNRGIHDYVQAWRQLVWSLELGAVHNPSCTEVWFLRNGTLRSICGGETLGL
jgi:peptidoglycan/xylan/chitin deacetylase (PgdA/CDA1 family)